MMTYSTGRYGTIPSLPKLAQAPTGKDILTMTDVQALGGASGIRTISTPAIRSAITALAMRTMTS